MTKAMLRGFLKIVVLKALDESPKSGYGLMKYVEEKLGVKPSPGSIYPLLEKLKEDKKVSVSGKGRKKTYKLTEKGKSRLKTIEQKRQECISNFISSMKMLSALTGEDLSLPMQLIRGMQKGEAPFKELNPELANMREELFRLLQQGKLRTDAKKIKKIFAKTARELKAV